MKIKYMNKEGFKCVVLPITYYKNTSLEESTWTVLCLEADRAYKEGVNILILTDRGVDENHVAIPSLLSGIGNAAASCNNKEENNVLQ